MKDTFRFISKETNVYYLLIFLNEVPFVLENIEQHVFNHENILKTISLNTAEY